MLLDTSIQYIKATTVEHYEIIRTIRNSGIGKYANNNHIISEQENKIFWQENKDNITAWIMYVHEDAVGICSLHQDKDNKNWSFVAVNPNYEGKGYGQALLRFIVDCTSEKVYGKVELTNISMLYMVSKMQVWRMLNFDARYNILTIVANSREEDILKSI